MTTMSYMYYCINVMLDVCVFQEYKPPCSQDIPIDFRVELLKNASNPPGILGSKGEVASVTAWIPS